MLCRSRFPTGRSFFPSPISLTALQLFEESQTNIVISKNPRYNAMHTHTHTHTYIDKKLASGHLWVRKIITTLGQIVNNVRLPTTTIHRGLPLMHSIVPRELWLVFFLLAWLHGWSSAVDASSSLLFGEQ